MRLEPSYSEKGQIHREEKQQIGVAAAALVEDEDILLLGSLGLDAHVALHDRHLHGWYEAGGGDWFVGYFLNDQWWPI